MSQFKKMLLKLIFSAILSCVALVSYAADASTNYDHRHWNQPPDPITGLRILDMNVQNYFNGRVIKGKIDFSQSRGPKSEKSYTNKKEALGHLVEAVNADILVFQEFENDVRYPQPAILDFTAYLKELTGWTYTPIRFAKNKTNPYGNDQITQFILYRNNSDLKPVGEAQSYFVKASGKGRPLMVQKFQYRLNNKQTLIFNLASSHLKSKRNTCGQDFECEKVRLNQATSFSQSLAPLAIHDPVIWVGDFNSEPYQPTMKYLEEHQWKPLLDSSFYSYVYEERKMLLDHVLISDRNQFDADVQVSAKVWNINNPPAGKDEEPRPVSDHDPLIIDIQEI